MSTDESTRRSDDNPRSMRQELDPARRTNLALRRVKLHSPEFDACGDEDFDPDYDWPCGTAEILLGAERPREGE